MVGWRIKKKQKKEIRNKKRGIRNKNEEGPFVNNLIEGECNFYRENGRLMQVIHFIHQQKEGSWIRYSKDGQHDYDETFKEGKTIKKK